MKTTVFRIFGIVAIFGLNMTAFGDSLAMKSAQISKVQCHSSPGAMIVLAKASGIYEEEQSGDPDAPVETIKLPVTSEINRTFKFSKLNFIARLKAKAFCSQLRGLEKSGKRVDIYENYAFQVTKLVISKN